MINLATQPQKWIMLGVPVLFIVGSLFHFIYEWSGESAIIGAIAPVNESIWEHLKLAVFPLILWWGLYYLLAGENINPDSWFAGALASIITAIITIPLLYYFYTEAFGVHLLVVDILLLLVALLLGQIVGLHVYNHSQNIEASTSLAAILLIAFMFMWFTFNPPKLPIFKSGPDQTYGIHKQLK